MRRMFEGLSFVVVDELHAFLSSERGVHLSSLLKRLQVHLGRRPRHVGLSATIGDCQCRRWLAVPTRPLIRSTRSRSRSSGAELKLQIRGIYGPFAGGPARRFESKWKMSHYARLQTISSG